MSDQIQVFFDSLVDQDLIKRHISIRKNTHAYVNISPKQRDKFLSDGWEIEKELSSKIKVKKLKNITNAFKDEVWYTLASLGFKFLNRDQEIKIQTSNNTNDSIDVLAIDDETVLIVTCRATDLPRRGDFRSTVEEMVGRQERLIKFFRKLYPQSKHKIKFILATKNYWLSDPEKEKLEKLKIVHFDEEIIQYYQDLTKHLGLAARFQLLGNLFSGLTIPELDNLVPAIQGKMGGLVYYSFSIEPEKLLKIGYVLHRNKANKKLMPTYQRIIKKSRLKAIQEFVDKGGFFPNSIVININSDKSLKFERSNLQVESAISRLGVLHLPKEYRSAFVIDGQHRLYGYANSEYKTKNTIPVVAFVNLEREKQVELFMQINENQKAVPKNLRNTLNSDLLWNSENLIEQVKALKLQIAQDLGEELDSPLYEKVIIGENIKTTTRCITIDTIKTALDRTSFFGTVSKDAVKENGSFYSGKIELSYKRLLPFLKDCFNIIKDNLGQEWDKGEGEENEGFITINPTIYSLIIIFSDIVDHLIRNNKVDTKKDSIESIVTAATKYVYPLVKFFKDLSPDDQQNLRRSYGIAGRTKYWRKLQSVIASALKDFNPPGLEEELKKEEKQFNERAYSIVRDLEKYLNKDFKEKLEDAYGTSWFKKAVPDSVYEEASALAAKKNKLIDNPEDEKEPWDCLHIIDYRKIASSGKNWSEIFEKHYTRPGEEKLRKDDKTKWMVKLETVRNKISHSESISEEEFMLLNELYEWLIKGLIQNKLA
jgi:DNA sulfur modification protein DndB